MSILPNGQISLFNIPNTCVIRMQGEEAMATADVGSLPL